MSVVPRQPDDITPLPILPALTQQRSADSKDDDLKPAPAPPAGPSIDPQTGAVIAQKTREERWYVFRLDMILLVYACGSQILKFLDQQNINNAYVSGMKEDLNLYGNEFNYFQTYFNLGYALFLIPSQIIITHVRPSLWLPALEFGWGILTLFMYAVKDAKQVYAIRAFMGALEASAYPGALMLLMSLYTPRELAFRLGFYQSSQSVGSLLSGGLQSAIQSSLDGAQGMAGWRWMFIINGLMTVSWAVLGLWFIPDFPNAVNKWSFWLKAAHVELAHLRNERFRRASNKKFTWTSIKKTFSGPLVYAFACLYPATVLAQAGYQYFTLFLKSVVDENGNPVWSKEAINAIPMGGSAITIVTVWVYSFLSDYYQTRWLIVMAQAVFALVPCIMLSVWNIPLGAKYFAYFATYFCLGTASPIFSWMSEMCPHDAEQRAFITGLSIAMYYAISSWSNVLIWPASEVPHYRVAWQTSIGLWLAVIIGLCALRYVEIKYIRPRNQRIAEERVLEGVYEADNAQIFAEGHAVVDGKGGAR